MEDGASQRGETSGPCRAITTTAAQVIARAVCLQECQAPLQKIFLFPDPLKSHLEIWPSHPTRGAYHDRTDAGWDAVDAAELLREMESKAGRKGPVSDQSARDERVVRTAKSCGHDAPTLASSSRSCVGPTGLRPKHIRLLAVAKRARFTGAKHEIKHVLKTNGAGMPGVPVNRC